ncbi:unnamed protein product [Ceratitis capitata]|uniref:(Mediterranean fruit fly) hypothetical protein n=1 Tax=Ceratitis capitata TaxID=7213 RepID=A0A811UTB8_CERCA|nr:unnamed protein product [Ceratitis capitata]
MQKGSIVSFAVGLIPPILNTNIPPPQNPNTTPELEALISRIVKEIVTKEDKANNPNSVLTNPNDQTIDPEHRGRLDDLHKIPDIIRSLREFSGNPGEFNW